MSKNFSKGRSWLAALALLFSFIAPIAAEAQNTSTRGIRDVNLGPTLRYRRICIDDIPITIGTTEGQDGLLHRATLHTAVWGGTGTVNFSATTTIATIPFPARLTYGLTDASSNNTLTCTGITITGIDHLGIQRTHTDSTVTETAETTSYAFSKVTRLSITGCTQGSDAGDLIQLYISDQVGLTTDVNTWSDVESLCKVDVEDGTEVVMCAEPDNAANADIRAQVNTTYDVIDLSASNLYGSGETIEDTDTVCFTVRTTDR